MTFQLGNGSLVPFVANALEWAADIVLPARFLFRFQANGILVLGVAKSVARFESVSEEWI